MFPSVENALHETVIVQKETQIQEKAFKRIKKKERKKNNRNNQLCLSKFATHLRFFFQLYLLWIC